MLLDPTFICNCALVEEIAHELCLTNRQFRWPGLQLGAPWKEIMAAHCCQQITNAQQYERKYDGNMKGNMEVDGNIKRNIKVDCNSLNS